MSLTSETMTPADIAAVTGNHNNNGWGMDGSWWIIILFLFAFMGWGNNGGFGNGGGGATNNYVLASDFATIQRQLSDGFGGVEKGLDTIRNGLCDGFYTEAQLVNGVNTNILTQSNASNVAMLQGFNGIEKQLADCCCQNRYDALQNANATQNAINSGFCTTNYNNANNTRDIIDNQNSNARAILDALTEQRTEALKEKIAEQNATINSLQLASSQAMQNNYLINALRPAPVPSFNVPNPYAYNGNCGCGC